MQPEPRCPGETVYPVDNEQPSRWCQNPFCGVRFDLIDPFDTEVLCGDCAEGGEPFVGCPVMGGVRL